MGYKDPLLKQQYQRIWIRKRREAFFKGKVCVNCGCSKKLELDHIDPAKKITHVIWSWSKERQAAEIAKCQILCHKCHVNKTKNDMGWYLRHGTLNGYVSYKCRCSECRRANRDRSRILRAKKRALLLEQ